MLIPYYIRFYRYSTPQSPSCHTLLSPSPPNIPHVHLLTISLLPVRREVVLRVGPAFFMRPTRVLFLFSNPPLLSADWLNTCPPPPGFSPPYDFLVNIWGVVLPGVLERTFQL